VDCRAVSAACLHTVFLPVESTMSGFVLDVLAAEVAVLSVESGRYRRFHWQNAPGHSNRHDLDPAGLQGVIEPGAAAQNYRVRKNDSKGHSPTPFRDSSLRSRLRACHPGHGGASPQQQGSARQAWTSARTPGGGVLRARQPERPQAAGCCQSPTGERHCAPTSPAHPAPAVWSVCRSCAGALDMLKVSRACCHVAAADARPLIQAV